MLGEPWTCHSSRASGARAAGIGNSTIAPNWISREVPRLSTERENVVPSA